MDTLLHDLRDGIRAYRAAGVLTAAVLCVLMLGTGAVAAMLALVRGGLALPLPYANPLGLRGIAATGGLDRWTDDAVPPAAAQTESLEALLHLLLIVTLVVGAIAFVNVVVLLLAEATTRRQELAVRAAVGASDRRLVRQLVTEGGALALLGAGAGLLLAAGATAALRASWPEGLPHWLDVPVDPGTAVLAVALALAATLPIAAAPLLLRRRPLADTLGAGAQTTEPPGAGSGRRVLVKGAVAATVVLLIGTGLLLRGTAPTGESGGAGLDPEGVLTLELELSGPGAADARRSAAVQQALLQRVAMLPDVRAESIAAPGAWTGVGVVDRVLVDCGGCVVGGLPLPMVAASAAHHAVGPRFFETIGAEVRRGREFTAADDGVAEPVIVINRSLAALFQYSDPLGRGIRVGGPDGRWHDIVGIVDDVRARGIGSSGRPVPALYVSALQHPPRTAELLVRAADDPAPLEPAVRQAVRETTGERPVPETTRQPGAGAAAPLRAAVTGASTLERRLEIVGAPLRWFAHVFGGLAGLAALLAAAAVYGLISYDVDRRTREIGLQRSVGARRRQVLATVVRRGLRMTTGGVALGLFFAVGVGRVLQTMFSGVPMFDAGVYGGAALLVGATTVAASLRPALRAARIDPAEALRAE